MIQVSFSYNNQNIIIQSNINEKMKDLFQKFLTKIQTNKNSIYFFYQGKLINEELQVNNIIINDDKQKNKMNIIVSNTNELKENNFIIKSENLICPKCGENCFLEINNYKLSLFNCKNGHNIKDLEFDKYEKTQEIDKSKIICEKCKENNKSVYNEFFRCLSCKINLCPVCKSLRINHII